MWMNQNPDENFPRNGFYTPPPISKSKPSITPKNWMSEKKFQRSQCFSPSNPDDLFHVLHKVPHGHSPYIKAKHVQMIERDPDKAVSMFWNAINSGDRVDSALKDMAAVMKQLNRPNEAIEAIRSFRYLCPADSQESIDNVLLELYKRSGRLEEEIQVLQLKLKRIEEANAFGGKKVRSGRSHGKRVPVTAEQEYARLLGNLAWAYLQQNDYKTAEDYYRKALSIESDKNKQCNLAVCLMCLNKISEAKLLLQAIQASAPEGKMDESYAKSFERASGLLAEIEVGSSFDSDKENRFSNVDAFAPNKKRAELTRINWRGVSVGWKRGPCSEVAAAGDNNEARNRWRRTYTPPIPAKKVQMSPLTQPRDSGHVSHKWQTAPKRDLSHCDRNQAVSHLPRRLQFEKAANNQTDADWTSNGAQAEYGCKVASSKGKKSWADMVEEEEVERMNDLLTSSTHFIL